MRKLVVALLLLIPIMGAAQTYLSEDFEGTWPPSEWYIVESGDDGWEQGDGYGYGDPSVYEGSYFARFDSYSTSSGVSEDLVTDTVDLSSATSPRLRFYYINECGSDIVAVDYSTDNGATWTNLDTLGVVTSWTEYTYSLPTSQVMVRFVGVSDWGYSNIGIDNVVIDEAPSADVAADSIHIITSPLIVNESETIRGFISNRVSSATGDFYVYFSINGSVVDSAQVSLDADGMDSVDFSFTPSSGGVKTLAIFTALSGDGNASNDTASVDVYIFTGPWVESFSGTDFPPTGWTVYNFDGEDEWERYTDYYFDEPACARIRYDTPNNDWLITPKLTVNSGDTLRFWYRVGYSFYEETLYVKISTTDLDTASFTVVDSIFTSSTDWQQKLIPLDAYASRGNIYVAFVYPCDNNFSFAIDAVEGPNPYVMANDIAVLSVYPDGSCPIVGSPVTFKARVANLGTDSQTNVPVSVEITAESYSSSYTISSIAAGETLEVTFPDNWTPSGVGCFEILAYSANPGDEFSGNDSTTTAVYAYPSTTFFCEGFDGDFPPADWYVQDVSGTSGEWYQAGSTDGHPSHDPVCGLQAYFNSFSCSSGDETRLVTDTISIPSAKVALAVLKFWMYHDTDYFSSYDSLYIDVSTDYGANWITLAGFQRYSDTEGWVLHSIYLASYSGQDVLIGFRGHSGYGNDVFIDQVAIITEEYVPSPGDIVINEFVAKGAEWVELYNKQAFAIPLDGWILADDDNTADTLSGSIAAGGYIVHNNDHINLNNNGDVFFLISPSGDTIDMVACGNEGGAPVGAQTARGFASTARAPDGADTDNDAVDFTMDFDPTPGAANDAPAPQLGSSLVINEVDAYVPSGDPDYIEIYNPSEDSVDLDGWIISDGDEIDTLSLGVKVPPEGVVGLYEGDPGSFAFDVYSYLANSDVVYLFTPSGVRVDQVGFRDGNETQSTSYQRYPDGAGPNDGYNYLTSGGDVTWFARTPTYDSRNIPISLVYETGFEPGQDTGWTYTNGPHSFVISSGFKYWGNDTTYIDSVYAYEGDHFLVCAEDSLGYGSNEFAWWMNLTDTDMDLSPYVYAKMVFRIWYHNDDPYDQIYVLANDKSRDGGIYYILDINGDGVGDYNDYFYGNSNGWITVAVDLSAFCGEEFGEKHDDIEVAFLFESGYYNNGPDGYGFGVAIDDIKIYAGGTALVPPQNLHAEPYQDAVVPLTWQAPARTYTQTLYPINIHEAFTYRSDVKPVAADAGKESSLARGGVSPASGAVFEKAESDNLAARPIVRKIGNPATKQTVTLYRIYRKGLGDPYFVLLDSTATTSYDDYNVVNGETYQYVVTAVYDVDPPNESNPSNIASAKVGLPNDILIITEQMDTAAIALVETALVHCSDTLTWDLWKYEDVGTYPDSVDYAQYPIVFFLSGTFDISATEEDIAELIQWIDNGGKLFISGEDVGYDLYSDPDFAEEETLWSRLQTIYLGDIEGTSSYLWGVAGDPITDDWATDSLVGSFGHWNDYADTTSTADVIFTYGEGYYPGTGAATKYADLVSGYKTVWTGFDIYEITDQADIDAFICNMLDWFLAPTGPVYVRGDANADGTINVTDAVFELDNLFPPQFMCERAADANADDALNVSDVLFLLNSMFPPTFPAPTFCGDVDTFNTVLTCDSFPPCGYYTKKMVEAINANAKIEIGAPEYGDGYVVMPVYMESDVEVAGIQLELSYGGDYSVAVETEGCVTEDFDYFRSHVDAGEAAFIGVYSLTPAMNGEVVAGLEAGRYRIAEIRVVGSEVPEFKVENAVLASRYGYSIEPEILLGVGEGASRLPKVFALFQNIPNPFGGNTVIKYALPKDVDVELTIYNIAGQKVRTLVNGHEQAGYRTVKWDGRDDAGRRVAPGVYFYKLKAGKFEATKKLTLVR